MFESVRKTNASSSNVGLDRLSFLNGNNSSLQENNEDSDVYDDSCHLDVPSTSKKIFIVFWLVERNHSCGQCFGNIQDFRSLLVHFSVELVEKKFNRSL